jgi:hypothetical protein
MYKFAVHLLVIGVCAPVLMSARLGIAGEERRDRVALASRVDASAKAPQLSLWDSNAHLSVTHSRNIYWINNQEIIFVKKLAAAPSQGKPHNYHLSVWNIQSNTVRAVLDLGDGDAYICFSDGHLAVSFRSQDLGPQLYVGTTKSLTKIAPDTKISPESCLLSHDLPTLPSWVQTRSYRRLERVEWGFVDFGDRQKITDNSTITFYRNGAKFEDGVELPLRRRETKPFFRYFPFADAHFVESTYWQLPRPRGVPYRVYWLYRDGRIDEIAEVPFGPWRYDGSTWTEPTKRGVLLVSHNFNVRDGRDLQHAGLYLVSGRTIRQLLSAWIHMTAVSPNGCHVALDYANHVTRTDNRLMAFDLCSLEER